MEDSLRNLLSKSLEELPTYTDVGRLAKRIDVIIVNENTAFVKEQCYRTTSKLPNENIVDDEGNAIESVDAGAAASKKGILSPRISLSNRSVTPVKYVTSQPSQQKADTTAVSVTAASSSLKNQTVIITKENSIKDVNRDSDRTNVVYSMDLRQSHAHYLAKALKKVLVQLEPLDDHMRLIQAVDSFEETTGDSQDLQKPLKELFQHFDEANSRTIKIFKLLNQATLSTAITPLKLSIPESESTLSKQARLTKDVRTMDGWRVVIKITLDEIIVSHIRTEQSFGKPISPDYWDVRWRFDITFNVSMSQLKYAKIVILDLTFGSDIPQDMKSELIRLYEEFDVQTYLLQQQQKKQNDNATNCNDNNKLERKRSGSKPQVPNLNLDPIITKRKNYYRSTSFIGAGDCHCILS